MAERLQLTPLALLCKINDGQVSDRRLMLFACVGEMRMTVVCHRTPNIPAAVHFVT